MVAVKIPAIGLMNERISLQKRSDDGNASGGIDIVYKVIADVWAAVRMESGGLLVDGVQDSRVATHRIRIRNRPYDWNSVLWNKVRMRIISTAIDDSRQYMEMLCEAENGV